MTNLTPAAAALRAEVEAAVMAEVARVGVEAFNRRRVLRPFMERGGKQSTLYRWVDAVIASGKPHEAAAKAIVQAAKERVDRAGHSGMSPAAGVAKEVSTHLPTVPTVDQIATAGAIPIIERLNICLTVAAELMAFARTPDGKVRNSKLLLASSDHLRRCIETASRITDTLMRAEKIERYHAAIMEEIGKESPETAARICARLAKLSATWGNN